MATRNRDQRRRGERDAFLADYTTPATTTQAYNFGKVGGFTGKRRLSFAEFFRNDSTPRPYGRIGIYRAYRIGFDIGRRDARNRDERETIETDAERRRQHEAAS